MLLLLLLLPMHTLPRRALARFRRRALNQRGSLVFNARRGLPLCGCEQPHVLLGIALW